jgi:hypothetical protein
MELDDLNPKLHAWKAAMQIPPRFQAEVWQRIVVRDEARRHSIWNRFREGLLVPLAKPQYASALVAAGISLSLGVAHLNASRTNAKHWKQLESRYVNSIVPQPNPSA